jgi:dephospho-CoA kinase
LKILGLTGSIGMGKSTAAKMLRRMGVPVHCADEAVHKLLAAHGKAVRAIAKLFPPAFHKRTRAIDRKVLGAAAFADARVMKKLETILHPLVEKAERDFLKRAKMARAPVVVLDIPLLYETGAYQRVDAVMVVSAPAAVQKKRVLARTGRGRAVTYAALKAIIKQVTIPTKSVDK